MKVKDTQLTILLEPVEPILNEGLRQYQPNLTYQVFPSNDRQFGPNFQPPHEELIKPYEEPIEELNQIFAVDEAAHLTNYITDLIDDSIDPKEKEKFYSDELGKLFNDIVNQDVEQASLRLFSEQLVSVPEYDLISGQVKRFKVEPSQQILSLVENDSQQLSDAEFQKLLDDVEVGQEYQQYSNGDIQEEQKQILEFLESTQQYMKKTRTNEEEEKNDLQHIDVDQILQKKQEQVKLAKQQQEKVKQLQKNQKNQANPEEKLIEHYEEEKTMSQIDEIDLIVQDSTSFKQAIERNKELDQDQLVVTKQNQEIPQSVNQKWHEVDQLDMKRFKEMIPHPAIEYPFELDDFQKRAVYRLEQGNCVFVAAHTSAGKTVVAEYAIALAFKHMTKTIYTSPIKALSNQKYREFKDKFGDVGIQTGDVTLNTSASCIIMTTEILQEMLYNDSDYIKDVEWVIFDEVHYINDPERGSVWEEVIMKLPEQIQFVMLSATVPNYKEFADWVGRTKRKMIYVQMTEKRPVPLQHMLLFKDKLHLIKDEFNHVYTDTISKVLKEEQNEFFKKRNQREEEKKKTDKDDQKLRQIDFKEKANKAKEKSIQKVAMKGMKQSNGGGGQSANSQNKNNKKYEKFYKHLITISREKLLPCVVFCFSRAACEDIPVQLEPSLEFTTGAEKGEIKKFLKQKLQRLSDSDRSLPQIQNIQSLLIRGIGVHHAGMLPIMKEIIEILFSDGYLKVVFATTTFAIGLNMPARSVFFTQVQKFNGSDMELLQTSEYLQMAGRAGRRGKDPTGTCLLNLDRAFGKMPTIEDFEALLENRGTPLESKLKLSYSMTLNLVKSEDVQIGDLIKTSFYENESEKERAEASDRARRLQVKISRAEHIECTCGDRDQILEYHSLFDNICNLNRRITTLSVNLFIPMCIIEVLSPRFIMEKMVVLQKFQNDEILCLFIKDKYQEPIVYEDEESNLNQSNIMGGKRNSGFQESIYYEYVRVNASHIIKIFDYILKLPAVNLIKDQLPAKFEKDVIYEFLKLKVFREYKPDKSANQKEMQHCRSLLNTGGQEKLDDFKSKIQVLIHYKYLDYDLNLLFKGKVAQQLVSVNKFLMTELIFSGILKELSNEEIIALFSVLNAQIRNSKYEEVEARISESFQKALNFLQDECAKLIDVENKFGVADSEDITQRLNFNFYEILYEWANQKPFVEVVKLNNIDEGSIVRMVQHVGSTCRHVKNAARIIGDAALAQRMDQAQLLIKRDIIFTPSLYLE